MQLAALFLSPPWRRTTISVSAAGLIVSAAFWYFGADVWHALLLGSALTLLAVIGLVGLARHEAIDTSWRRGGEGDRTGSRNDVAKLSWSLRGSYGRVDGSAAWRVRRLARDRLALRHLELFNPAHRTQIEQLIGRQACAILLRDERRRQPRLSSLTRCLDALEALEQTQPQESQ